MMSVEQVEVASGDDLVRQGDPGDYYYMLTKGRAVVRRDAGDGKGPLRACDTGPGDAFGEGSPAVGQPRNSTVTMLQDGEVLRLSKQDFLDLIHNPCSIASTCRLQAKVDRGAIWLDPGAVSSTTSRTCPGDQLPVRVTGYQAASLAPDGHYVLTATPADGRWQAPFC